MKSNEESGYHAAVMMYGVGGSAREIALATILISPFFS
jgi:hypothetical protein